MLERFEKPDVRSEWAHSMNAFHVRVSGTGIPAGPFHGLYRIKAFAANMRAFHFHVCVSFTGRFPGNVGILFTMSGTVCLAII